MSVDSKRIALRRIQILFQLAREAVHDRPELAERYVKTSRKIAMRTRLHLPKEYRLNVCKHCKRLNLPGVSSRVRLQPCREPHVVVTCLYCGEHTRIPLKKRELTRIQCRKRNKGK